MREDKKRNTDIVHNILCPFRCREPHVCAALDGWDLCSMLSEKSIWGSLLPPEPHLPSHPARCRTRAMLVRVTPMSAMPRERTKTVNTNQVTASSIQTQQTPFFTVSAVKHWKKLYRGALESPCLEMLETSVALCNLSWLSLI